MRWIGGGMFAAGVCLSAVVFPAVVFPGGASAQSSDASSEADRLFAESAEHYRAGRFEEAARLLEKAHALTGAPVLLFNLAKAREGSGDLAGAIAAYEQYLREAENIPDRGAIEKRIETLREQVREWQELRAKAEAERLRAEQAAKQRPTRSASPFPWLVAGIGGAGLIVGGVLGALAKGKEADAIDEPIHADAAALAGEAEDFALGANICFGIGGGVLLAGATWGIVDVVLVVRDNDAEQGAPAVSLRLGPLQAGLTVTID